MERIAIAVVLTERDKNKSFIFDASFKIQSKGKSIFKRWLNSENTLVLRVSEESTIINTSRFFQLIS